MKTRYHRCSAESACSGCKNVMRCMEYVNTYRCKLEDMRSSGQRLDDIGARGIMDIIQFTPIHNNPNNHRATICKLYTYIGSMDKKSWQIFKVMYKLGE